MKRTLLFLIFISTYAQTAFACTFVPKSFCETASLHPESIVVSGTVTAKDSDGINLELIEVISGVETRTNIRIWDGTDFECNGVFSMAGGDFVSVDDVIFLILPKITDIENSWDIAGDYRWPNVYEYTSMLRVIDNTVTGFISGLPFPTEQGVFEFDFDLFTQYWIEDSGCDNITDTDDIDNILDLKFYPNPASSHINLLLDNSFGAFKFELIDIFGRVAMSTSCDANCLDISISHLPQGSYLARIRKKDKIMFTTKFIKFL